MVRRHGRGLLATLLAFLIVTLLACQPTTANSQSIRSGQSCAVAASDASLAGGTDPTCGFELGSPIATLDCSQITELPSAFAVQRSQVGSSGSSAAGIVLTDGRCRLAGAGKEQILSIQTPVSPQDVVEIVDFRTRAGPVEGYDLKARCSDGGCVTFTVGGPGFASDTYEKVRDRRSHSIDMPWSGTPLNSLVHTTQANRAIIALRGRSITVCLNGRCWSSGSSAVAVTQPGDAVFSVTGDDSHNPADVDILRMMVFQA
jgi:hypothetical protein